MRRNPSTVVVLAGRPAEQVLAAMSRSLNVVLVRSAKPSGGEGGIEAAAVALRRAAGVSAPYVLVAADPLSAVAAAWQAMWDITADAHGSDEFELRAAEALAAWRAKRFELPDYYLVLADDGAAGSGAVAGTPGTSGTSGASGADEARWHVPKPGWLGRSAQGARVSEVHACPSHQRSMAGSRGSGYHSGGCV